MDRLKIENTIKLLTKDFPIKKTSESKLIDKLSQYDEKSVIKELSMLSYRIFSNNDEHLYYALSVIRNINPNICPSVEEIKTMLFKTFTNDIEGNITAEENHHLVIENLIKFTKLFNTAGIDYYVVGALPCFLKAGIPLFRYHDDIDIMINENDLIKISELIESTGYQFYDDRYPSIERFHEMEISNPPHTVLAQNPNNEFHIGFFIFRREEDNSLTIREYSHREENGEVIVDVLERYFDKIGTLLRYEDNLTYYADTCFKTSTIEYIYNLKNYTKRPKDITDMKKLEHYINKEKLEQIKLHSNKNIIFKNVNKLDASSKKL